MLCVARPPLRGDCILQRQVVDPTSLMPTESSMTEAELCRRIEDVNRREEELAVRAAELDDRERRCAKQ